MCFQPIAVFEILILAPWRFFFPQKSITGKFDNASHKPPWKSSTETQSRTGRALLCSLSRSLQTEATPTNTPRGQHSGEVPLLSCMLLVLWTLPNCKCCSLRKPLQCCHACIEIGAHRPSENSHLLWEAKRSTVRKYQPCKAKYAQCSEMTQRFPINTRIDHWAVIHSTNNLMQA